VVVETLHALVAVVAVHSVFGSQVLTIDAYVIQVQLFINKALHQTEEIFFQRYVSGINQCQTVEEDRKGKPNDIQNDQSLVLILLLAPDLHSSIVAGSNHEERHVDYVEEKDHNLSGCSPFYFLDRSSQTQALAAFGR